MSERTPSSAGTDEWHAASLEFRGASKQYPNASRPAVDALTLGMAGTLRWAFSAPARA